MSSCRTPTKVRYPNQAAAVKAIDRLRETKPWQIPNLTPYTCGNHWHLGHHNGGMKFKGRPSKRGGRKRR